MIACDTCSEWFHGSCVGVSTKKGKEIEDNGYEWTCPKCEYNSALSYLPNEGTIFFLNPSFYEPISHIVLLLWK